MRVDVRPRSLIWEAVGSHCKFSSEGMIWGKRWFRKMNLIAAHRRNEKENSSEAQGPTVATVQLWNKEVSSGMVPLGMKRSRWQGGLAEGKKTTLAHCSQLTPTSTRPQSFRRPVHPWGSLNTSFPAKIPLQTGLWKLCYCFLKNAHKRKKSNCSTN